MDQMWERHYAPIVKNIMQNPGVQTSMQRAIANIMRNPAVLESMNTVSQRALSSASQALNSAAYRAYTAQLQRTNELIANRFSEQILSGVSRAVLSQLRSPDIYQPALERIRRGEADQLLREATELATSPEIQETIERADEQDLESFIRETETHTQADGEQTFELDIDAADIQATGLSEEDIKRLRNQILLRLRVLLVAFTAGMLFGNVALAPIVTALGGLIALLEIIEQMRSGNF